MTAITAPQEEHIRVRQAIGVLHLHVLIIQGVQDLIVPVVAEVQLAAEESNNL